MSKRSNPITWRPSKAAAVALAKLLEGNPCKNAVINEAVVAAAGAGRVEPWPTNGDIERLHEIAKESGGLIEPDLSPAEMAERVDAVAKKLAPVVRRQEVPKPPWKH